MNKTETNSNRPESWENVVKTLFRDVLEENELLLRHAIEYDSLAPGTIVTIISWDSGEVTDIEEIFSSCDFETFTKLMRRYLRRVNSHEVTVDNRFTMVVRKARSQNQNRDDHIAAA